MKQEVYEPLVSVIVPVFNVKPYLNEALDSVINQTYKNLEIILVDDGSTDGSGEICDEYSAHDKRFVVIHQENKGLSCARNTGLDLMKGELVAFIDSDDAYCPEFIRTMVDAMNHEKADVVMCKTAIIRTTKKLKITSRAKISPKNTVGGGTRFAHIASCSFQRSNIHVSMG